MPTKKKTPVKEKGAVKKTVKKLIEKVSRPKSKPKAQPPSKEEEQSAQFVEDMGSIGKVPHHKANGDIDWDMVNDIVDILAQRKPGIENLEGHDQHAISRHLYQHFKEAGRPVPDQIAALA